jgi:hypothetical protein
MIYLMRMGNLVVLRSGPGFLDQIVSIRGTKCTGWKTLVLVILPIFYSYSFFFPVPEQVRSSWIFNSHPLVSCYQLVWRADNLHSLVYPSIQQQLCFSFSHWGLLVIYCLTIIWVFMVSWQFEMTLIIYRIMYFSNHKSTIMRSARSVDSILLKVFHILLILVLIFVYRHHEACVI